MNVWSTIKDVYKSNENLCNSVIFAGVSAFLYSKFGIPVGFTAMNQPPKKDYTPPVYARNSTEAAISSLYSTAKGMTWDSDKIRVAKDIYELVKGEGVDDTTKTYAINILSGIASTMTWSSDKKRVAGIIKEIGGM